ncbi:MAG: 3-isopropylmalate dehydratase large subunit [Flammeovirgaceae bacterium]|nr:3-isopropylmalate dehydratase large subunit [Flammeovirgaceae bacterium]|tara:strand:- start:5101 stop:6492 length:1392 start_codon:yes stop_codon:yes gene_type:complete
MAKTLFDKVWDEHIVDSIPNGPSILYIDKHLIHEVTSPQAFNGIISRNINVMRPDRTIATADHNVPTENQHLPIKEELSRKQVEKLTQNCDRHNIKLYGLGHKYQGIVHVIGPELGLTQPGMTIVCGDSHTSTHGAFGSIAFGIGTSEVEMVLSTQCLLQNKPKTMKIEIDGKLNKGVYSKDIILYIISQISASGGTGYFVEYAGSAIESLSMESRMTICNMSIEMGARGGMIAPDEITIEYVKGKEFAPKGEDLKNKIIYWNSLRSDKDAKYDKIIKFNAEDIEPMITYGTNPGMGIKIDEKIPNSTLNSSKYSFEKSLDYMGINSGDKLKNKKIDYVFIGSCTNSRIEDLRAAAKIVEGKNKSSHVNAWVIPGSKSVEKVAVKEGLDKIFTDAGFDFRQPGCSACLAMNEDKIPKDKYCLSTSNRNFEGRQGPGSRTFLASPVTAALSAINGYVSDVRDYI